MADRQHQRRLNVIVCKLAGIKESLYHPRLPTLRRMDRDDVMARLPYEHSRTTTSCCREDFTVGQDTRDHGLGCKHVLYSDDVLKVMMKYAPTGTSKYTEQWNRTLNRLSHQAEKITLGSASMSGLRTKAEPDVTSSWQYVRPATAKVVSGWRGAKPIPAPDLTRYRSRITTLQGGIHVPWK